MDSSAVIAIAGMVATCLAALGTAWFGHRWQEQREAKQRQWQLEDEQRRRVQLSEETSLQRKRELTNKRLDAVEEMVNIFSKYSQIGKCMLPEPEKGEELKQAISEYHDVILKGVQAANALGISDKISAHMEKLYKFNISNADKLTPEERGTIAKAATAVLKIVDEMRN